MGACCGGMGTSHQHKSLPDKKKPAAAVAPNDANNEQKQQKSTNDVTSSVPPDTNVKTSGSGADGQHAVQCTDEAQFEAAITVLSESLDLESCPPPVAAAHAEIPAASDNHVESGHHPEVLKIEEDANVEVAASVNAVFAEPPSAAAAAAPEPVVGDHDAINAEDSGFEIIGDDAVQLRISEDGDLEKQAVVPNLESAPQTSLEEVPAHTDEQPAPVVTIETEEKPEIVEAVESHPVQAELELSEEVPSAVETQPEPEVSSAVPVADITAEAVAEPPVDVPAEGSVVQITEHHEVTSSVEVVQQSNVAEEQHQVEDNTVVIESSDPVPSSHEVKPTEEPVIEEQPETPAGPSTEEQASSEVHLSTTESTVPADVESQHLPVSEGEIVDQQPASNGDQPDGVQHEIPPPAAEDSLKVEVPTEPSAEEHPVITAEVESSVASVPEAEHMESEVKSEQPEAASTPAEDQQVSQSEGQISTQEVHEVAEPVAIPASEPADQVEVHPTSETVPEQPSQEPTPEAAVEPQPAVTEQTGFEAENQLPSEAPAEQIDNNPATSEPVDLAAAVETTPETVPEVSTQELPVTASEENVESGDSNPPVQLNTDVDASGSVEAPASAVDGTPFETQPVEHVEAAPIVAETDDLPPPEPELLSSPSAEAAADNVDSFPLPPPPPSEDSADLDHPTAAAVVDDNNHHETSPASETALVNGAASISPSDDSTASSPSTSGLSDEPTAAALKAAADFVEVDGQHSAVVAEA